MGVAGAIGVPLVLVSVAWACVLQQGTLLVCNPPSATYTSGSQCAKISGSGSQAGLPKIAKEGTTISVKATNFAAGRTYNVNFTTPSGPGCYSGGTHRLGSAPGPNFYLSSLATPNLGAYTGRAQICAAQAPIPSAGNTISVTVI